LGGLSGLDVVLTVIPAKAHCCPAWTLRIRNKMWTLVFCCRRPDSKKHRVPCGRHSRESGNPFSGMHQSNMDSRFRGNDACVGCRRCKWELRKFLVGQQRLSPECRPEEEQRRRLHQHHIHTSLAQRFHHLVRCTAVGNHGIQRRHRRDHRKTALTKLAGIEHRNGFAGYADHQRVE